MNKLKNKDFIGIIKEGSVKDNTGRYFVDIPELSIQDKTHKPIIAKNEILGNRFTRWVDIISKKTNSYGSYYPLHPGMSVNVRFRSEHLESAYVSNIISYTPLVDKEANRDSFYLLNKTLNDSWIYQDDSRNITHIMHNGGTSNVLLDNDSVTLSVGVVNNTIFEPINSFKLDSGSAKMQFGNSYFLIDDTGITLSVGETSVSLTETSLKMFSEGNVECQSSKTLNFQGKKLFLNGKKETHILSDITRISGGSNLSLTGDVINTNANKLLSLTSTLQVNVKGTIKTAITGGLVEMISLSNMYLSSSVINLTSATTVIDGKSLTLNGGSIMMDGAITHGIGVASSVANSMNAMNKGLSVATDAANMSIVSATQITNPVMSVANSIMTSTIPGSANAAPNIVKPLFTDQNPGSGVSEKINYISASNSAYDLITKDQFVNLHETYITRSV